MYLREKKSLTRRNYQNSAQLCGHSRHHILKSELEEQRVELHIRDCIEHPLVPWNQFSHSDLYQISQKWPVVAAA